MTAVSTSTKKPSYKITVDGQELTAPVRVTELEERKESIDYEYECDDIKKITIELLNKGDNDTKVVDDKIVEDLLLIISRLAVDQLDLMDRLSKISVYRDHTNQVHRTHAYITFNGTMTIKIHKNVLYNNWLSTFV